MACHLFDFLDFALGPIVEVHGIASNLAGGYPVEDTLVASYRFESGVHGSGAWCYCAGDEAEENEIVGDEGTIRFTLHSPAPILLKRGGEVREFAVGDPPHVHQPMIQSIVDEMNGLGECASTGRSAARTAWVMDGTLRGTASRPADHRLDGFADPIGSRW